jgi:outer membrane protein TolC
MRNKPFRWINACQQPLATQKGMIDANHKAAIEILRRNNWPQATLNGQATWQSEVTSVPIMVPGVEIPTLDKDQYRATLDIVKPIWDGGQNARQKDVQSVQTVSEHRKLEADLYATREPVIQLYCAGLLANNQVDIIKVSQKDLLARKARLEEQVANGTAIPAQVMAVEVRLLELEQQETEAIARKSSAYDGLALLTGISVGANDKLQAAEIGQTFQRPENALRRPEFAVFDARQNVVQAQSRMIAAKNQPRFNAIGTLGYARPGLNFLSNEFEPYAIFGVNMRWNLTNFYTGSTNRERQQLEVQMARIGAQRAQFELQTNIRSQQQVREVERLEAIIQKDRKIVELRDGIVATSQVQVEAGVITESEYLTEVTQANAARLTMALHEVQLMQARLLLNFINGQP